MQCPNCREQDFSTSTNLYLQVDRTALQRLSLQANLFLVLRGLAGLIAIGVLYALIARRGEYLTPIHLSANLLPGAVLAAIFILSIVATLVPQPIDFFSRHLGVNQIEVTEYRCKRCDYTWWHPNVPSSSSSPSAVSKTKSILISVWLILFITIGLINALALPRQNERMADIEDLLLVPALLASLLLGGIVFRELLKSRKSNAPKTK